MCAQLSGTLSAGAQLQQIEHTDPDHVRGNHGRPVELQARAACAVRLEPQADAAGAAFRIGHATVPTVSLTIRLKVPARARTLRVRLFATDVVGNDATAEASVRLH